MPTGSPTPPRPAPRLAAPLLLAALALLLAAPGAAPVLAGDEERAEQAPREEPAAASGEPAADSAGEDGIEVSPVPPAERAADEALTAWYRLYRRRMAPVHRHWGELVLVLSDRDRVAPGCRRFAAALGQLELDDLVPVPDRRADLHFRRTLGRLEAAAQACSTGRLFTARYRLELAAASFFELTESLRVRGLGIEPRRPQATTKPM